MVEEYVTHKGKKYKVTYNECETMLKKREYDKKCGASKNVRRDFCDHPNKIKELVADGWEVVGQPHTWMHLVREQHNVSKNVNKEREELNLQFNSVGYDEKKAVDEAESDAEYNPEKVVSKKFVPENIVKTFDKASTWFKVVVVAGIVGGLALGVGALLKVLK